VYSQTFMQQPTNDAALERSRYTKVARAGWSLAHTRLLVLLAVVVQSTGQMQLREHRGVQDANNEERSVCLDAIEDRVPSGQGAPVRRIVVVGSA
jgi:hypothetical protein